MRDREKLLSKRDLAGAKMAKRLFKTSGFQSKEALTRLVNGTGNMANSKVSRKDIENAIEIYG